ncbi:MAG: hypothetical protein Q7U31_01445, partial [Anaerolineaceae bacterium]|nr:hypothetical protein [Anaerolineaceae bacterium]
MDRTMFIIGSDTAGQTAGCCAQLNAFGHFHLVANKWIKILKTVSYLIIFYRLQIKRYIDYY